MTNADHRPELIDQLTEGIGRLTSSRQWRSYLELQGRFHRYSFGNVVLIGAQRPDATRIAGFSAWRGLDRSVRKGERAIWILAPMVYRSRSGTGRCPTGEAETDEADRIDRVVRGFKFVPVFDISQTEGPDLPVVCHQLHGDDPGGLYARLVAVAADLGYGVEDHEFEGGVNGDCSHRDRRIRVRSSNAPAQRVKTLAHEIAHALLHERFDDRALAELEAESTAYVVCQVLGLDTADYSFAYVALWSGGGEQALAGIRASGERIQRCAATVLGSCAQDGNGGDGIRVERLTPASGSAPVVGTPSARPDPAVRPG